MRALRPPPAVVVGPDHAACGRREREHGVTVLGHQVDADAARLRQGEDVAVGRVLGDDLRAAGVDRPSAGCREVDARNEQSKINRVADQARDGQGEVGGAAPAPSDRCRLDQVGARFQVALHAGIKPCGAVIVVGDAGAILGQQVQVGIGLLGHEVDSDAASFTEFEAIRMGIAPVAEARFAVLRRPATGGHQWAL